jgi:uncharacterized protein YkwD
MLRGNAIAAAIALTVGCVLGSDTAVASDDGCAPGGAITDATTLQRAKGSVLCLVNSERATRGLARLRGSRLLARSAHAHSRDMVARRYFSHIAPEGMSPRQRIMRFGYLYKRRASPVVAETIAWGTRSGGTPGGLVRSFMDSPGHRQILLDRRYRHVGIGLVRGVPLGGLRGGATLTLDFGRR